MDSGKLTTLDPRIQIPVSQIAIGQTYRVRIRYQDDTGRWSHWSSPIEFTPTQSDQHDQGLQAKLLKFTIIQRRQTPDECAGYSDNNAFEFLEILNASDTNVDLASVMITGGVSFRFKIVLSLNLPVVTELS
ncbi:MAG: hypothetical protein R3C28_10895 [Pirellulaceae bacterium]